jgi:hypothetical protein
MTPIRSAALAGLALLLAAVAAAQETVAPTFSLEAPASCNAQQYYTCSRTLTVANWTVPPPRRQLLAVHW